MSDVGAGAGPGAFLLPVACAVSCELPSLGTETEALGVGRWVCSVVGISMVTTLVSVLVGWMVVTNPVA